MSKLYTIALILLIGIAVAACETGEDLGDLRADRFFGGAPTDFSGPDADDAGATAEGSEMVSTREFDFTPTGFTLSSGAINNQPVENSDYTITGGTLDLDGDVATVDLDVTSANPDVTDIGLVGTFSAGEAQSAIVNPGRTFTVNWDVSFEYFGVPVAFSMAQDMSGSDFM